MAVVLEVDSKGIVEITKADATAKYERQRIADLQPDAEKLRAYAKELSNLDDPNLKTDEALHLFSIVTDNLVTAISLLRSFGK